MKIQSLEDQDPIPEFKRDDFGAHYGRLPPSERQKKEWADDCQKADGEDWVKDRDSTNPHVYINGKGQRKVVDPTYVDPLEGMTDIPIPCVTEDGEWAPRIGDRVYVARVGLNFAHATVPGVIERITWSDSSQWWSVSVQHDDGGNTAWPSIWLEPIVRSSSAEALGQMEPETQCWIYGKEATREQFEAFANDGWIPHTPGDPMPCDPEQSIQVKLDNGFYTGNTKRTASETNWLEGTPVIAWKPA